MNKNLNDPLPETEYVSIREAVRLMGKKDYQITYLCKTGQLEAYKKSGVWRVSKKAIEAWIKTQPNTKSGQPLVRDKSILSKKKQILAVIGAIAGVLTFLFSLISAIPYIEPAMKQVKAWVSPRAFPPEKENEILIVIASFNYTQGATDLNAPQEIMDGILKTAQEKKIENIRVEIEPTVLTGLDKDKARNLSELYHASMVIWGDITKASVVVRYLNLREKSEKQEDQLQTIKVKDTPETDFEQVYNQFILFDLPNQFSSLSLYIIGQSFINRGNYFEGIDIISQAIDILGNDPVSNQTKVNPYFTIALTYLECLNDAQSALNVFNKIEDLNPEYPSNYFLYNDRSIALTALGKYQEALADINQALLINPKYEKAYLNRGITVADMGQYEQAFNDFDKAIKLNPQYAFAFYISGSIHFKQKEYQKALDNFSKAAAIKSDRVDKFNLYFYRGLSYHFLGNDRQMENDYNTAIRLGGNTFENNRTLSYYARSVGNLSLADRFFNVAAKLEPKNSAIHSDRAIIYLKQGEALKAIDDFQTAAKIAPGDSSNFVNIGSIYYMLNDIQKAKVNCERAVTINLLSAEAHTCMGVIYLKEQNFEGAKKEFDLAISYQPNFIMAYCNNAYIDLQKGNWDKAIEDYSRAIEIIRTDPAQYQPENDVISNDSSGTVFGNPTFADVLTMRAQAYEALGEIESAMNDYQEILSVTDDQQVQTDAQNKIKELEKRISPLE